MRGSVCLLLLLLHLLFTLSHGLTGQTFLVLLPYLNIPAKVTKFVLLLFPWPAPTRCVTVLVNNQVQMS